MSPVLQSPGRHQWKHSLRWITVFKLVGPIKNTPLIRMESDRQHQRGNLPADLNTTLEASTFLQYEELFLIRQHVSPNEAGSDPDQLESDRLIVYRRVSWYLWGQQVAVDVSPPSGPVSLQQGGHDGSVSVQPRCQVRHGNTWTHRLSILPEALHYGRRSAESLRVPNSGDKCKVRPEGALESHRGRLGT